MSLLPAFIEARLRQGDSAPQTDAAAEVPDAAGEENVFNLLPPEAPESSTPQPISYPEPQGMNRHPVDMTDLSRLSIDQDGRLYWDGKPVEVRRRITMSPAQIVGASVVAAFVVIGALGAVLQGSLAAREWACRLGWTTNACGPLGVPRHSSDIPA